MRVLHYCTLVLACSQLSIITFFCTGLLGPIRNINVTPTNSTCFLIFWTPPFTLARVPIDGYNVTISILTSAEDQVLFAKDPCLYYCDCPVNITIVPLNKAGAGDPEDYINNCLSFSKCICLESFTEGILLPEKINYLPTFLCFDNASLNLTYRLHCCRSHFICRWLYKFLHRYVIVHL